MPDWNIARLQPQLRPDFYRLHSEANEAGWCFCAAWWLPTWEGWGERTAEENRAWRQGLFDRGEDDGYLLYRDGVPVGWCQSGPRDRLVKLCREYDFTPDPQVWALTCFLLAPAVRGQGLAHRLLAGVLEDLRERRVTRVQAFPRRGEGLSVKEIWTGTEDLFRQAGFALVLEHPRRPVYEKRLD